MKAAFIVAAFLAGCSSVESLHSPSNTNADGLTYYMPKKDFVITVSVTQGKAGSIAIATSDAYPDLGTQYILRHGGNVFGKNTLDVGIGKNGLLSSAKSTTVSNVNDAFKNLASAVGAISATGGAAVPSVQIGGPCSSDGPHIFSFDRPGAYSVCGNKITINIIPKRSDDNKIKGHSKAADSPGSGIYYRQTQPYLVTAVGEGLNTAAIVFSPSESKTMFLPVSRTFFSSNDADFGFEDGAPTKYKQETEGEIVALLKLPADVLAAYFGAVGSIFDAFKSTKEKEADALAQSLKLDIARKQYEVCLAALREKNDDLFKEMKCE